MRHRARHVTAEERQRAGSMFAGMERL